MRDLFAKFAGVLEFRIVRLLAAVAASYLVHGFSDLVSMGYLMSPAALTAVVFLAVYSGLRFPAQGAAALSIAPALFIVSFAMFGRDMLYFVAENGFDSAPAIVWSILYGPYPGISYFMDDARILGAGKSIGWIQAALYLVVLAVADGVTRRKIEDLDLYMRVNMTAKAGVVECAAMGCFAVLCVEATPFGGVFSAAAFFIGFFVTLKIPAVSGLISTFAGIAKSMASKPRFSAAPKGASVTDRTAAPPAPSGDSAVPPKRKPDAKQKGSDPVPTLQETLAARGKDASRGIMIASGESRRKALELAASSPDSEPEPEPEVDTSDDEILLRGAASMEEARQPVLMSFLAARILPILGDVDRIERLREDRSLRMVIDSVAEYPDDLAAASDRYMALLESKSGSLVSDGRGREEGDGGLESDSESDVPRGGAPDGLRGAAPDDDDGFMSVEDVFAQIGASAPEPAEPAAIDLGDPYAGEPDDALSGIESSGDFGGVVYGAGHDPLDIVDSDEYSGEFGGMDASEVAASGLSDEGGALVEWSEDGVVVGDASEMADGAFATLRPALAEGLDPPDREDDRGFEVDESVFASDGAVAAVGGFEREPAVAAAAEIEEMERPKAIVPMRRPASDESLIAKAVPMTEQEVSSVGARKIRGMAQGSLSAFANGLAKIVLEMSLGGHDEDEAVEWIQDRLPSGVETVLDEARFLFGVVALASGYSDPDRRLAKRRLAFLLTADYRAQRLSDVESMLKTVGAGSSVPVADLEDALRYVEGVCAIFPQLTDRESGADRYAVARALLSERIEDERRKTTGTSALEVGAQRMRDVAAGKGRAVLDAAPSRVKSIVAHVEALRGFFDHLISKASFDSARDRKDMADHETREAADEVLALGQMAYGQLQSDKGFVEGVVRAVRPMTADSEVLPEFARIIGPDALGFYETVMLERRVPMRKRMADLEARLADAERRAGEGSGAMRSAKAAFEQGVKDPIDVILERVAAESAIAGEDMVSAAFPILRSASLSGGVRILTYSHTALQTRVCGYLPVYGMGAKWSSSQGDGDDFVLAPSNAGVPTVSMRAFVGANAQALAEAGVCDLKILLMNGSLDSESSDCSIRNLGPGDAWDGDKTAMRSTAVKGNVLLMEDLALRFTDPAVKFGMAAKSGFHRHFEKLIS